MVDATERIAGGEADRQLISELSPDLASREPDDRARACAVLARLGSGAEVLDALKRVASTDPDEVVLFEARRGYHRLKERVAGQLAEEMAIVTPGDPPVLDRARFERFLVHPSAVCRIQAIFQALRVPGERALPAVLARLTMERDDWVVATLVRAVGRMGQKKHVEALRGYLSEDTSPRVTANALEAIATLEPDAAFTLGVPLLSSADARVQAAAARVLMQVDRNAAFGCLRTLSRSPWTPRRGSALHCLAKLADPEADELLAAMLASELDGDLRKGLVRALGAGGGDRAAVALCGHLPGLTGDAAVAVREALTLIRARVSIPDQKPARRTASSAIVPAPSTGAASRSGRSSASTPIAAVVPPRARPDRALVTLRPALALLVTVAGVVGMRACVTDPAGGPPLALHAVATADAPAVVVNRRVACVGAVQSIDLASGCVLLACGPDAVSVTFGPDLLSQLSMGESVEVHGVVVGRSNFGTVYLQGQSFEKR